MTGPRKRRTWPQCLVWELVGRVCVSGVDQGKQVSEHAWAARVGIGNDRSIDGATSGRSIPKDSACQSLAVGRAASSLPTPGRTPPASQTGPPPRTPVRVRVLTPCGAQQGEHGDGSSSSGAGREVVPPPTDHLAHDVSPRGPKPVRGMRKLGQITYKVDGHRSINQGSGWVV